MSRLERAHHALVTRLAALRVPRIVGEPDGADIRTLADVDREGVRVIGIANTTTIRSATRALKVAQIAPVPSVEEAIATWSFEQR